MGFAFGRDRRLRIHTEFVRAQRIGRRIATKHFTLLVAAQPASSGASLLPVASGSADSPGPSRMGLVVGRKVGNAVRRNRIKRVCRECFRLWPDLLPPGVDLVVIARPGADELGLSAVRAEWAGVQKLLRKRAAEALAPCGQPNHPGKTSP